MSIGQLFVPLKRIPFFLWLILAQAFLLVNISTIVPQAEVSRYQMVILLYMVMTGVFLDLAPKQPWMAMNLNQSVAWFVGGIVGGTFALFFIRELPRAFQLQPIALSGPLYLLLLHAFVVGVSEEWIFRGWLGSLVGAVPQAVIFGLFHYAAYGAELQAIAIAVLAGLLFWVVMRYTNIWLAAGLHTAWNLVTLGVV